MELPNLAVLDMSGNPLTVNCLRTYYSCLKEMTELTSMNLSDCGITDGVMEDVFRELPSIA
jgi:Ran GTPase-activating protein (RanGAP) involved in mRNA processing and transport